MTPLRSATVLMTCVFLANSHANQSRPVEIASRFLPPGAEIGNIYKINPATGKRGDQSPAVLVAHVISASSNDLVLAYYSPASSPGLDRSLFVDLLHEGKTGYVKVWEGSYYGHILLVPDALRVLKLPGEKRDAVGLISGRGASIGGQLQILRWDATWGFVNVMPENGPAHGFSLNEDSGKLTVTVSFEKYPGEKGVPPPIMFRWDGSRFVKVKS